jgi:hypothetical protein
VALAALLGGWLMSMHLPVALVLPTMSILMVVAGFIVAAILYLSGSRMGRGSSGAWEVAGALVFLGFAAAILSDDRQAMVLFDQMETRGLPPLPSRPRRAGRHGRPQPAGRTGKCWKRSKPNSSLSRRSLSST